MGANPGRDRNLVANEACFVRVWHVEPCKTSSMQCAVWCGLICVGYSTNPGAVAQAKCMHACLFNINSFIYCSCRSIYQKHDSNSMCSKSCQVSNVFPGCCSSQHVQLPAASCWNLRASEPVHYLGFESPCLSGTSICTSKSICHISS